MSVILDTSVVIDVLRGSAAAVTYVLGLEEAPTCSEVTRTEVLRGARSNERTRTERLFSTLRWCGVDEQIARRAGEIGRRWRRNHQGIATANLIIASTAVELELAVATLNTKRFPMFKGLRPPYA